MLNMGCSGSPTDAERQALVKNSDDVVTIAKHYQHLKRITPESVLVNPIIASSCIGASKGWIAELSKTYGPHTHCAVTIYMNELAADCFNRNADAYPVGAVIVKAKEKLGYQTENGHEGTGNGVGGMIKREDGFDSSNGNWEYFYFEDDDKIESGKIDSCIQCHIKASNRDFVFGSWHRSRQPRNMSDYLDSDVTKN